MFLDRIAGAESVLVVLAVIAVVMKAAAVVIVVVGVVVMEANGRKRTVFCNNYVVPASLASLRLAGRSSPGRSQRAPPLRLGWAVLMMSTETWRH